MRSITRLPSRPLRGQDIAELNDSNLQAAPYGGLLERNNIEIYALKLAAGNTAHALGFDDSKEQWQHLGSVEATDLAAADTRLDSILDDWVTNRYGTRFEVLKTV